MKLRLALLLTLLVIAIILGGYFFWYQYLKPVEINLAISNKTVVDNNPAANKLPSNQKQSAVNDSMVNTEPLSKPDPIHSIKILNIPFTSQAPMANWDAPYQDACEEASMLMVAEFFLGNHINNLEPSYADEKILQLVDWQKKTRGFYESTTAQEVVSILNDYYKLEARVITFDIEQIKLEILAGNPIILPAAGRLLGNPYFHQPGPLYHMLVIKGYENNEFITNDPGTRHGLNYRYTAEVLSRAVHDWNQGVVEDGQRVMIVVTGSRL